MTQEARFWGIEIREAAAEVEAQRAHLKAAEQHLDQLWYEYNKSIAFDLGTVVTCNNDRRVGVRAVIVEVHISKDAVSYTLLPITKENKQRGAKIVRLHTEVDKA